MGRMNELADSDAEIFKAIKNEIKRQENGVELIASENFVSRAVMQATGSVLTNKYSEGYPKKRYYGGNEFVDVCEQLAIDRACKLFSSDHANVQPHSGSSANMEAYYALLEIGDKILGMDLSAGGHLTHGHPVNFSGKHYKFSSYNVDPKTFRIDMDEVRKIALREKPKMILSGFSAYPRAISFKEFREIADEIGAYHMADIAHIAGLCAKGLHENPVPHCDVVATTTHKTLRGPRGAMIMCREEHAKAIDKAVFPGMQGGPLDHVIAAKAVAFGEALKPDFLEYQKQILKNAKALADSLIENGINLLTGGTDNHLMLVDLTNLGIGGKEAETALDEVKITCNKNMIPYDKRSPFNPSGIRLGTPAVTSRGFGVSEMKVVGECISKVLKNIDSDSIKKKVHDDIQELVRDFQIYPGIRV